MIPNSFKLIPKDYGYGTYRVLLNGKELFGVKEVYTHVSCNEIPVVALVMQCETVEVQLPEAEVIKKQSDEK